MRVVPAVVVAVPVIVLFERHMRRQVHRPHALPGAGEDLLRPRLHIFARIEEEVGLPDHDDVRGGRLVGVALHPRRQQQRHVGVLPRDLPRKVVLGKEGRHNLHPAVLPAVSGRGRAARQQEDREEGGGYSLDLFHLGSPWFFAAQSAQRP